MQWPETLPLAGWLTLHAIGILAALLTRLSIGTRTDVAMQAITGIGFLAIALLAVGTMMAGGDQLRLSILSAGVLGTMVVTTVIDSRPDGFDPVLHQFSTADE